MSVPIDVNTLLENDLVTIFAQSTREMKRRKLMKILTIEIDEEENLKEGIWLDYCLDCIIFASNHGFQWKKVLATIKFGMELLHSTASRGLQLEEALCIFRKNLAQVSSQLDVNETKKLIDFLVNTFFQHYQLYLYCMTIEQDVNLTILDKEIELPPKVDNLSTGITPETWNYQQKIKHLEDDKDKSNAERTELLQTALTKIQDEKSETEKKLDLAYQSTTGDDLQQVLQNLTKLHVGHIETEIQNSVSESKDNVEYSFKRGLLEKSDTVKSRPLSKNRPRSKNKARLPPH